MPTIAHCAGSCTPPMSPAPPTRGPMPASGTMPRPWNRILALRHEAAHLLGFANYAERSLATKMAESPQQVLDFLNDLAERSSCQAHARSGRSSQPSPASSMAWQDLEVLGYRLLLGKTAPAQIRHLPGGIEALFSGTPRRRPALFAVVERLYGMHHRADRGVDTWHPDVRFYRHP